MYKFSKLLKEIRKESNLTQEELASILSVSTVLISMIETDQKKVSKRFIIKLAEKLEVHPSSITPFIFLNGNYKNKSISSIEKKFISIGEKLQLHLIKKSSKKLKIYASKNKK